MVDFFVLKWRRESPQAKRGDGGAVAVAVLLGDGGKVEDLVDKMFPPFWT